MTALRIRIEGASSPFPVDKLAAGVALLRAAGHVVDADHAGPTGRHAYLNGDDDHRLTSLEAALRSDVDVVLLARGGYGLTRIVDDLFADGWPERLPLVCGFSDVTALFARFAVVGRLDRCIHGPLATSIVGEPDHSRARFFTALHGDVVDDVDLDVLVGSDVERVEGPLFAANLVVLAALCGTPAMPDLRGHIVVVEEVGERPYRLDRLLTQLINAGAFDGVLCVVVGHLTGCDEPASVPSPPDPLSRTGRGGARDAAPSGRDVVVERLGGLGVPVLGGLAAGHEAPNLALPLGGRVVVDIGASSATLSWR